MKKITLKDGTLLFIPEDYIPSIIRLVEETIGPDPAELIRSGVDSMTARMGELEEKLRVARAMNAAKEVSSV